LLVVLALAKRSKRWVLATLIATSPSKKQTDPSCDEKKKEPIFYFFFGCFLLPPPPLALLLLLPPASSCLAATLSIPSMSNEKSPLVTLPSSFLPKKGQFQPKQTNIPQNKQLT
jgi:hypothetical protein